MSSRTATIAQGPTTVPIRSSLETCQQCGADLSHSHPGVTEDAQRRITELEAQVKILTDKATAAVDKLADYEDELQKIKGSEQSRNQNNRSPSKPEANPQSNTNFAANARNPLQSRLSYLLPGSRRSMSQPPSSAPASQTTYGPMPSDSADLMTLLTREQSLRQAAETRVSQTNEEMEELSAQLFSEANEMVATERKARAKLEERVLVLERRDGEKRTRLEVLEKQLNRIERVRELLKEGTT